VVLDNDRMLARFEIFGNEYSDVDHMVSDFFEWSAVDVEEVEAIFASGIVVRCHISGLRMVYGYKTAVCD
jgi:hypothetical protein